MAQCKSVLKIVTMTDDKTKQKAIETAIDVIGIDSIAADMKEQQLTVIGSMDPFVVMETLDKAGLEVDNMSVVHLPPKEE